jgi:hypothetical protein
MMAVERTIGGISHIDVLDRVLDKGIVIDAWMRIAVAGLDLITMEATVTVASIATYLQRSEQLSRAGLLPAETEPRREEAPVPFPAAVLGQSSQSLSQWWWCRFS